MRLLCYLLIVYLAAMGAVTGYILAGEASDALAWLGQAAVTR